MLLGSLISSKRVRLALLAATALGALAGAPAQAAPGCQVLSDATGDVVVEATGAATPDSHLDLTAVRVRRTAAALVVTITDAKLDAQRQGNWRVELTAGDKPVFVEAGLGAWVNAAGDSRYGFGGFRAGRTGARSQIVRGSVDYASSAITVFAPWSALGVRSSAPLRGFSAQSHEAFVNEALPSAPAVSVTLADTARSTAAVAGTACR
jgi:hypothetical protein